jgi:hypothetical protein
MGKKKVNYATRLRDRALKFLRSGPGMLSLAVAVLALALPAAPAAWRQGAVRNFLELFKRFNVLKQSLERNLAHPSDSWMGALVHSLMVEVNGPSIVELVSRMDLKPGETCMELCFGPGKDHHHQHHRPCHQHHPKSRPSRFSPMPISWKRNASFPTPPL